MNKQTLLILLWEKQIKTIEVQGEKQTDALENLKDQNKQLVNVKDDYDYDNDYEDKLLHSKEREMFEDICKKGLIKLKK